MFCRVVLLVVRDDVWMRQFPVRHTHFLVGREIRLLFLFYFIFLFYLFIYLFIFVTWKMWC